MSGALAACTMTWAALTVVLPAPLTSPPPGPALETVTPAQLAAMGLHLDVTVQPVELPDWLAATGVRLPSTVLLRNVAEAVVRDNSSGVQSLGESVLAYATLTSTVGQQIRAPILRHRLVWTVVGTRAGAGTTGGLMQMVWLVDARAERQLVELAVPAVTPALGAGAPNGP